MLRGLTAKQFVELEAFAAVEPFVTTKLDYLFAALRETIFNMSGKESKQAVSLDKFLLQWEPEDPEVVKERERKALEERIAGHRRFVLVMAMEAQSQQTVKEV